MPKQAIGDITLERIRAFVNGDAENISDKDNEILTRLDYAYDQLKVESPQGVANRIVRKFGVHINTARSDVRNCQLLFSPIHRYEADWLENFIINDAKLQIEAARELLDMKAWAGARKHLVDIYEKIRDRQASIDPSLLGNNKYFIVVNIDDTAQKVDYDKLNDMPLEKRFELTDFLFNDIDAEEAKKIMNE